MQLLTLNKAGKHRLGVKTECGIVDMELALTEHPSSAPVPIQIMEAIALGDAGKQAIQAYLSKLDLAPSAAYVMKEEDVVWGPCVPDPSKIICVGLNYRKHADETNSPYPEVPILFNKFSNALSAHEDEIIIPPVTNRLDYEVELCMVMGKQAQNVSVETALDYIYGYCTANDLSARDLQKRTSQWMIGKTSDGFCPIGPYLVTADEITDPQNLKLSTHVNGEQRQNSTTADMIFSCAEIISFISQHMTLQPGDIILTGTPEGVVMGFPRDQQVYIQPGDTVTVEVEGLGVLTNVFVN